MSGQLVVVFLLVALIVGLIWYEVRSGKPKTSSEEDGEGRPIGTLLRWGLIAVVAVLLLGAMGEGCDEEPDFESALTQFSSLLTNLLTSFPLQSVESLEVLGGERLLIANDNNYPFSDGRWTARNRPDDTEMIIVRAPALR